MPAVVVSQTGNVLQRQRVKNCGSRRDIFDQVGHVNNHSVFLRFPTAFPLLRRRARKKLLVTRRRVSLTAFLPVTSSAPPPLALPSSPSCTEAIQGGPEKS